MSDIVLDLAQRGQTLAPSECERLVELLLKSLVETTAPEIKDAWNSEIELRVAGRRRWPARLRRLALWRTSPWSCTAALFGGGPVGYPGYPDAAFRALCDQVGQ